MRWLVASAVLSLMLILSGFLYDVFFAGIPYQEPPPDLQARWLFHKAISNAIMLAGVIGLALVATASLLVGLRRGNRRSS